MRWKILDAWQAAAAEVGIAPIDEFNRGDNSGSSYFHVNQKRGRRWSMADAFLHPVAHRPNLTVYTQTQAVRLLMDDQVHEEQRRGAWTTAAHRATGVQLLKDGRIVDVHARREVILSAGAIGSPHLMQVSGLGRPSYSPNIGCRWPSIWREWVKTSRITCSCEPSTASRALRP